MHSAAESNCTTTAAADRTRPGMHASHVFNHITSSQSLLQRLLSMPVFAFLYDAPRVEVIFTLFNRLGLDCSSLRHACRSLW